MHDLLPLAGRSEELAVLRRALRDAVGGRGQLWLVCGEPGIGKTRLVEELMAGAGEQVCVLHGSAWEAGGAPAYWPWVQALRQLLRELDDAALARVLRGRASWLRQMLPEIQERLSVGAPPALDPEQAQFQLMDSVACVLRQAAGERPLLLVLEDLHAADPSSVLLLDFLARELRGVALLVIATYREAEARSGAAWPMVARLHRHAQSLVLGRLAEAQVAEVLERVLGRPPDPATLAAVQRSSEGNPLFLGEMARWLEQGGDVRAVPEGIRGAIRARLDCLPDGSNECLALASVIGRDFGLEELALSSQRSPEALADALRPALDAALISRGEDQRYRFSHHCIREVIHEGLPEARRWALHRKLADVLEARLESGGPPPHAELAHHLLEAGPSERARALDACVHAAEHALGQLAFDDAALGYERALGLSTDAPAARRAELSIGLGQARTLAGDARLGRRAFEQALALARQCQDPILLARAALALGSELVYAEVDASLVRVLQEALDALGSEPSSLRAEVMARLAAALQPAADPQVPIAMARQAIEMARAAGEERALLSALRNGCSSLMDLVDPLERLPLNLEMAQLAERLGSPLDALRAAQRLTFDHVELGDRARVLAWIDTSEALATTLTHPVYGARVQALRAMLAIHDGRFEHAEAHLAEAARLAARTQDRNVPRALTLQRFGLARLRGDREGMRQSLAGFEAAELPHYLRAMADLLAAEALASDESAGARARFGSIDALFALGDCSLIEPLVHASDQLGDGRWLDEIYEVLRPRADRFVSWGSMGMLWGPPVRYLLGIVERLRGHPEQALRLLVRAEEQAEQVQSPPQAAWCAYERCRALEAAGRAQEAERVRCEVAERATALGLFGLVQAVEPARPPAASRSERASSPPPAAARARRAPVPEEACSLRCEGETWLLSCGARQCRLKDTKGVRLLARLVEQPGREFHVLDLSDAREAPLGGVELIDARAREAYTRRAESLREELAEAESFSDRGRVERLRGELDQVAAELARAVGLGGRHRKAGDAAERARVNVQRRLRDAVERIREHDPVLGKHFDRALRTGAFCSYDPS